ncbi:MAG: zinc-binding dehydrogenase [Actinobacteria bacterium]|nr:zinc-binding dehydrogenase [Actinomycetota bacterium]NCW71910.1 zinc-binding dehydrogenase [Actinomycetota bacterium]NCZ62092.1 zinc-binding dehydrogenase [Actinomycetota bacterium]
MRAGRISVSRRAFEVVDVPTPDAGAGQVRIKVGAAGVCLSDVHFLEGILSPGYLEGDHVTLGHEVAGTVDQVGAGVTTSSIGDRVVVIAGERNAHQQITTMGFDYDGGWAEYVVTKAELVAKIPDSLAFEQAAIIPDAVSTPWAAITSTGHVVAGEKVAVFGVGGLGIHAVQLLKIIGAFVIAIDPREDARANALARGADCAFAPDDAQLKKHRGLNAAFDFAGVSPVRKQALSMLGEQGRLVIVGIANEPIVIPNDMAFTYMRTQIMGHYGSEAHHVVELIELAVSGRLDLSDSISEVLPLERAADALDKLANKVGNPIRIVLKP